MDWQDAAGLGYARERSSTSSGHDDWRLPNAKELQSIVDYTRSPDTTARRRSIPSSTPRPITNEAGQADYPLYWTSTTHAQHRGTAPVRAYVAFGRALGYMNGAWMDVHGAGAQRSDPKAGDPADYPTATARRATPSASTTSCAASARAA